MSAGAKVQRVGIGRAQPTKHWFGGDAGSSGTGWVSPAVSQRIGGDKGARGNESFEEMLIKG